MTTQQLIWMTLAYLVALVAVVCFTRATARRVVGALLGGAVVGVIFLGVIALGESVGWWRVPMASTPSFLTLFWVGSAISCSPIYLVTWRVARRFGWRGLTLCLLVAAVIGPPRCPRLRSCMHYAKVHDMSSYGSRRTFGTRTPIGRTAT
jgi:hypothetical protein